jgi:hypothetical protein
MTYKIEHDWGGLIRIVAPDGSPVATLEKHASGRPGSGTPVDTHAKLQAGRAELMAAALNGPAMGAVATEAEVDPWVIIDKLRLQHSQEIRDVWMPLVAELRETAMQAEGALAAIQKISERIEGVWYDPYGDLESDVRSVIDAHAEGRPVDDLDGDEPTEDEDPSAPAMR